MRKVPIFGSGVYGKSATVTRQRRLNCYYEIRQDGDKTKVAVYGTPGMTLKKALPTPLMLPIRGMLGWKNDLYTVASNEFQKFDPTLNQTYSSNTVGTISGNVSFSSNNHQVVFVDGAAGYLYDGTSLSTIGASFPNGAKTITFITGFFVAELPGTQQFYVSNANDGTVWNGLAFASAEQYPDFIQAVDNLYGNLLVFSQQHLEWWQNVGSTPQPFAPILSATAEYGLAAIFSRAHVNNTIAFLAQSPQGQVQVAAFNGYSPYIISTPDIDYIINQFSVVNDAVALSYLESGHAFYQLTFPTEGRSFLYDFSTQIWSEVQTGVTQARHIANLSTYVNGQSYFSDYKNSNLYIADNLNYTDNGTPILREIISRHASDNFNVFSIDEIYLDMETGVGTLSGQGKEPQIMMQLSRDNGHTWEPERWVPIGLLGHYRTRVVWRRCGSSRDFVARWRMTDPVKFVITEGAATVRSRPQ